MAIKLEKELQNLERIILIKVIDLAAVEDCFGEKFEADPLLLLRGNTTRVAQRVQVGVCEQLRANLA
eukprot:CAMPEP_0185582006 /NCGR_PEP_ID=MMETSP0434-20130131/19583_1 /TAXON_ID=626734 ORGANISM="Favella taraikaensis, Strain Fe Narragansett Bay" /NCGR_SAMPLE_ID=MMETSP0434 /ASSEMBLY_ACC=CAM_ASM_000379 /LENGTH=66 /DNA_ID=CAMNT_0028200695 /DNA_START=455 /DNA_END=655 /DNA_ORIENTATION=-